MVPEQPDIRDGAMKLIGETADILLVHRSSLLRWEKQGDAHPTFSKTTNKKSYSGREIKRIWKWYFFGR